MYPLLPTMQGASVPLLQQAIKEMEEYYKGDALSRRLLWFRILLERVKTIPQEDKDIIEKELHMFDELLEGSEYIQEIKENAAIESMQTLAVDVVQSRFPMLAELAQQRIAQMRDRDKLRELARIVSITSDEDTVRWLLNTPAA